MHQGLGIVCTARLYKVRYPYVYHFVVSHERVQTRISPDSYRKEHIALSFRRFIARLYRYTYQHKSSHFFVINLQSTNNGH